MDSSPQTHDFDLTQTPTLQAVASSDEQALVADLQQRVDDAIAHARQRPDVASATAEHETAEEEHRKLQTASRTLNELAREVREQMARSVETTLDQLIASAATGAKPDFAQAAKTAGWELRDRLISRALQRLVEHLTPLAEIRKLRAESHALLTRAKGIEGLAHQRAEKLLEQLRDAVSDEVVLPVDLSKGVSGALLSQAAELKRRALESSANADRLEAWYMGKNLKESK
jgi:hypothetical protein